VGWFCYDGLIVDKDEISKRAWNTSDEMAQKLRVQDFGRPEHVREMAAVERRPESYAQAREILHALSGKPFTSRSGLTATLSRNSIDEILSGKQVRKSFEFQAHLQAAANLDKLYENAIEPWAFDLNPEKNNDSLTGIRRLFAPMEYGGKLVVVKITVKEIKNPQDGNRIYTIKALEIALAQKN
jgi:hypothetical protein